MVLRSKIVVVKQRNPQNPREKVFFTLQQLSFTKAYLSLGELGMVLRSKIVVVKQRKPQNPREKVFFTL